MVSQATINSIEYIKTIDTEFNMKLILIFLFFCYAVFALWVDMKYLSKDKRASFTLLSLGAKIYYFSYLIFLPTFIYQLPITEDLGFLLLFQTYLYSIGALFGILILSIYLIEKLFKQLGWEISMEGLKINIQKLV